VRKYTKVPAISGKALIKLLKKGGWVIHGRTRHGVSLIKPTPKRTLVTVVPDTSASLPDGTLSDILGPKQTGIRKRGLLALINKYGI
jgi:predicted RNA binding protein YcfA (HicA-like mRNA interferase family)